MGQTLRVLVVEDVDVMRDLLSHVLSKIPGVAVSGVAQSSWEARLEVTRRRPDLVLLDEILPGESTIDLINEMRVLQIPVLLMTGVEDPNHPIPDGVLGRVAKPAWETLEKDRKRLQNEIFSAMRLTIPAT